MKISNEVKEIIVDILNDVETQGCEGMGTITIESINKLRGLVGWPTEEIEGEDDDDEDTRPFA